jgi:hypothetical protein
MAANPLLLGTTGFQQLTRQNGHFNYVGGGGGANVVGFWQLCHKTNPGESIAFYKENAYLTPLGCKRIKKKIQEIFFLLKNHQIHRCKTSICDLYEYKPLCM